MKGTTRSELFSRLNPVRSRNGSLTTGRQGAEDTNNEKTDTLTAARNLYSFGNHLAADTLDFAGDTPYWLMRQGGGRERRKWCQYLSPLRVCDCETERVIKERERCSTWWCSNGCADDWATTDSVAQGETLIYVSDAPGKLFSYSCSSVPLLFSVLWSLAFLCHLWNHTVFRKPAVDVLSCVCTQCIMGCPHHTFDSCCCCFFGGGVFFVLFLFFLLRTSTIIRLIVVEICASVLMPPAVRPSCNYQNVDLHWM